ncbi:MAG TPA: vitamin B12 dependent-methionine synthase activation domain-containing protein, partial [Kiloniellales bacterium]|nr:vitamin B12 dependent-methionine synthase activation domain-containing protein [Kiloniellales bacterium]
DLGVMAPCAKILETARKEKADMIGLSGLITPSLDEMCYVAGEMKREGFEIPLLIGGATTSRMHTAVKIAPRYDHPVIHVLDASRAVGVAGALVSKNQKQELVDKTRSDYEALREKHGSRGGRAARASIDAARRNRLRIDWSAGGSPKPNLIGLESFDGYEVAELIDRIDWKPFFTTWELHGRFPEILEDEKVGEAARGLFADAKEMLEKIVAEQWVRPRAVIGFWPANSVGDDIEVYDDESRAKVRAVIRTLRQQMSRDGEGRANLALADFIAPKDSGKIDWIGGFAVTAGPEVEQRAAAFKKAQDDYSAILLQALGDRLAEAFAERMHERVRREFWGYAPDEDLSNEALIAEQYRGIRPAPGYPACPDHSEKETLFGLLEAEKRAGISLTESFAMTPASSVSGYYFAHPESRYFGLGRIDRDQVEDYAERKGVSLAQAEAWLMPTLSYDPAAESGDKKGKGGKDSVPDAA